MNQERLMKVLVGPIVSEKSTMIGEKHNQYSFVVVPTPRRAKLRPLLNCCLRCRSARCKF